jgi:hypothetical protein
VPILIDKKGYRGAWMEGLPDPVRRPKEDNPYYPLHPDHPRLSPEERRLDRLNAIRLQETPDDLVYAWVFFRTWYLRQAGKMFYKRWRPSPPFHYQIIRDAGTYQLNATAAPRGTSKSTVLSIELPLVLGLTRLHFNSLLIFSTDRMVTRRMSTQIMYQLRRNKYIIEDFGEMLPTKGEGTRSIHLTQLRNGSLFESISVKGALLGPRPDFVVADDVEFDPVLQQVRPDLIENFDRLLSDILLPMLDEGEGDESTGINLIGTLHSFQCFLYHVVTTREDSRFFYWNRRYLDCEDDGHGNLLWPEKFSQERLDRERETMGLRAYNTQRRNRPGTGADALLPLDSRLAYYEVDDPEPDFGVNPLSSRANLRAFYLEDGEVKSEEAPFGATVSKMFRVMTFDWAKCATTKSDFCAMHVIGVDGMRWFSLDLLVAKLPDNSWIRPLINMARRWRVAYIGIEAVAAQSTLTGAAQAYLDETGLDGGIENWEWVPIPVDITYPSKLSKEDRITALSWRYEKNLILYPRNRMLEFSYRQLRNQTEGFTGQQGCLPHDDAIDTLAMVPFLVRSQRRKPTGDPSPNRMSYNIEDHLKEGNVEVGGVQLGLAVDMQSISDEALTAVFEKHWGRKKNKETRIGPYIGR